MAGIKRLAIILVASALFLNGAMPPATWGQSDQPAKAEVSAGQKAAAGATNIVYVPGKAIGCTLSAVLWVVAMAVTLGGGYKDAASFVDGGCGGTWIVKGEDLSPPR